MGKDRTPMGLQLLENNTLVFLSKDGKSIRYGFTRKGLFIDSCAFNAYSHSKHHRKANNTDTYMFRKMARKELKKRGLTIGTKYTHSRNNNLLRTNVEGINFDEYGIYNNAMQYLYYKGEWAKPYEAKYCDDWSSIDLDCPQYVFFGKESNKEWVKDNISEGFETGNSVNCPTTDKLDTSKNKTGTDERLGYIKELEEKIEYLENRNENLFRQKMLMDVTIMNLLLPKEEPTGTKKWWKFKNRENK